MTHFTIHHILSLTGWEYLLTRNALRLLKIVEPYYLSGAGAHGKCATFEVWVEANGPEFIELDEILDRFVKPSNLLQS
jgi:hypothetical protein